MNEEMKRKTKKKNDMTSDGELKIKIMATYNGDVATQEVSALYYLYLTSVRYFID